MSDEKIEREQNSAPTHHEMSETPFGSGNSHEPEKPATAEPEPPVQEDRPAQQPEPEVKPEAAVQTADTPVASETPQEEEPISMDEAMQMAGAEQEVDYAKAVRSLREHDVVDGVVVHIDSDGVLVDVGTKSEGTIKPSELSRDPGVNPEDVVSVGDTIKVYVVQTDTQDGGPVLSKKRADFETAWERVEKASGTGEVLKAMVTDRVKGGLVVDLGIRGFVPASHVGSGKIKNLERFVGQSMPFKVIEVDRERRKVVLSNRLAVQEEREGMRKTTLATLAEGQIRDGVVRRLTDYGAFVDLGGVDGLLHISEMSWTRINHPSESVRAGQKIQVMVLKLNLDQGRVSLGLRQILPDPWQEIRRIHTVGTVITGTVTRLVPFGAFVQVEGGVEGIIPNSELAPRRVNKPEDVASVGQEVQVKLIDLRPDERRMTLSLRQLQVQKEKDRDQAALKNYAQTRSEGKTTIADLIGDSLGDFASTMRDPAKPTRKKTRAKSSKKEAMEEAEARAEAEELIEAPAAAPAEPLAEEQPEQEAVVKEGAEAVAPDIQPEEEAGAEKAEESAEEEKPAPKTTRKRATKAKAAKPKKAETKAKEKKPSKTAARAKKPAETEATEEAKAKQETEPKQDTEPDTEETAVPKVEEKAEPEKEAKPKAKAKAKK